MNYLDNSRAILVPVFFVLMKERALRRGTLEKHVNAYRLRCSVTAPERSYRHGPSAIKLSAGDNPSTPYQHLCDADPDLVNY